MTFDWNFLPWDTQLYQEMWFFFCCCFLSQKHGDRSRLYPNTTEALSTSKGRVLSQSLSTVSKTIGFPLMLPAWKPILSQMKSFLIKIMVLQFSVKMIDFSYSCLDRCLTVKASGCDMNGTCVSAHRWTVDVAPMICFAFVLW